MYGVDIQPIAIQISKLRFFISLVCDQKTNRRKKDNHGIRPLPNLETKFVAADTLVSLQKDKQKELYESAKVRKLESELQRVRHDHFATTTRQKKLSLQKRDLEIRDLIAAELEQGAFWDQTTARQLADWDPFDPQSSADYFEPLWMFDKSIGDGFDIVIQNPPYISHEKFPPKTKEGMRPFDCWEPYADLYCYFIEKALLLLRKGGISCSITSNSFLRADYGGPLRSLLVSKAKCQTILSIDKSQVFENAIVNVAVLLFAKDDDHRNAAAYLAGRGTWKSSLFSEFLRNNTYACSSHSLQRSVWALSADHEISLVESIESRRVTLASLKAKIRLGLATGANNAFLLSKEQHQAFVEANPDSAEILKPVIRGRDVDRYQIRDVSQYLILAKNGVDLPKDYPELTNHLDSFGDKFKSRGAQGQHWYNLRSCSFYDDFELDRIVWIELTEYPRFAVCPAGVYLLNTAYFLLPPSELDAFSLVGILNSSVSAFYMKHTAQTSGMGVTRWFKEHVSSIPICKLRDSDMATLSFISRARMHAPSVTSQFLEDLIDACVMECYFRDHMAELDLLFLDDLAPLLENYDSSATEIQQAEFLENLYQTLNAPESPIRNRLLRLTADSPDLLAIIKQEGAV